MARGLVLAAVLSWLALGTHPPAAASARGRVPRLDAVGDEARAGPARPTPQACAASAGAAAGGLDCGHVGITEAQCVSKGCCWSPTSDGSPWCVEPLDMPSYEASDVDRSDAGVRATLTLASEGAASLGQDAKRVAFHAAFESPTRLRVKMSDDAQERFEVPRSAVPRFDARDAKSKAPPLYDLDVTPAPFAFAVKRRAGGAALFDTADSTVVYKDQLLSISTQLPTNHAIFGLGESTRDSIRLKPNTTHTLWNVDCACFINNTNLYGSHPFYVDVRSDGSAHGVLVLTSNAADFRMDETRLTALTTGGVLDVYFFLGPTVADVLSQYVELVGRPAVPPRWALGAHQSKYGYPNLSHLKAVVANYSSADLPLEVIWSDIDYMDSFKDWTWSPSAYPQSAMRDFAEQLQALGKHYVVIVDPGILLDESYAPFAEGIKDDVFWRNAPEAGGGVAVGQVWPGPTAFPDLALASAKAWWSRSIDGFLSGVPVSGLWIDMNEPSNFCTGAACSVPAGCPIPGQQTTCCLQCDAPSTRFDDPPYRVNNGNARLPLATRTLAPGAINSEGVRHYDVHNLYGLDESVATHDALVAKTQARPFVLSRSTFVGSGRVAAHWSGDNGATWASMRQSIAQVVNANLFGIPMTGADICGFVFDTTEELCARWTALGSFYPFTRNHASLGTLDQEPYRFPLARDAAAASLAIRYNILPALETAFFVAAAGLGTPAVAAPLWAWCADDAACLDVSTQFVLADALLVSPVLEAGVDSRMAYFPSGTFWPVGIAGDGTPGVLDKAIVLPSGGSRRVVSPVGAAPPLHLRGGRVLPMYAGKARGAGLTTSIVAQGPYRIVVALAEGSASGRLFWDDGKQVKPAESSASMLVRFEANSTGVAAVVERGGQLANDAPTLLSVEVLGIPRRVEGVHLDGEVITNWRWDDAKEALIVEGMGKSCAEAWALQWS